MRVSTCCGAVMTVGGSGTTHYYVCAKCQRSCESMAADGKAKSSPAEGLAMGNGSLNKLEVDYGFKLLQENIADNINRTLRLDPRSPAQDAAIAALNRAYGDVDIARKFVRAVPMPAESDACN